MDRECDITMTSGAGNQRSKVSSGCIMTHYWKCHLWIYSLSLILAFLIPVRCQSLNKYVDINSYIKFSAVTNSTGHFLRGAEGVLEFQFRFCSDHGMLIYQSGGSSSEEQGLFFALGVNSGRIYAEWRVVPGALIEVFIGDQTLTPNTTHKVVIFNLGSVFDGTTFATIDNQPAPVEYLTPRSSGALNTTKLRGDMFVGGYQDVYDLRTVVFVFERASDGMVFYLGDPAYLVLYMEEGRLVLGLNTRVSWS
ncbi:hypothetical protein HOLleu_17146 [Holothuria leucospilota]|uniref:Uncharacterized protein n=1 Tax=Holothuria leucospilota TaxID=206669 RepID=A0A9Q1C7A1_HOLLE|nr:hypothetical protein HOLleu_17146 [Holothuria leucospilota]